MFLELDASIAIQMANNLQLNIQQYGLPLIEYALKCDGDLIAISKWT
ncbi:MAG: hypothetical protein IPL98_08175 [Saprospiraceae bacterium]|nr:hypothetical protein [Saprospiraceae bacterium]